MGNNVNVVLSNSKLTGKNSQMNFAIDISSSWESNAKVKKNKSRKIKFPEILDELPAELVKDKMEELALWAFRELESVDKE
jgi:hypothetical protein